MTDAIENEKAIQAKGLNAPRVTPNDVDAVIVSHEFLVTSNGTTVCEITLRNGFTVRGDASVVSLANYDKELGEKFSYAKARRQIPQFEAYLLQERLGSKT